jgi:hypothetical protein
MPFIYRKRLLSSRGSCVGTFVLVACYLIFCSTACAAATNPAALIPSDAVLFVCANINRNDQGQEWVLDALVQYLLSKAGDGRTDAKFRDIELFKFSGLCFALLPQNKQKQEQMIMTAGLLPSDGQFQISYGDSQFQLNIRDEQSATHTQKDLLIFIIGIACGVPSGQEPEGGILFNPAAEKKEGFSAFYVDGEKAIIASNKGIVKSSLGQKGGLVSLNAYKETVALLPKGWDAYGYASNETISLAKSLGKEEEGWQALLLTLLKDVRHLGFALDVQDKNHSRLSLVLFPDTPEGVHPLRERLEPITSLLLTKYLDKRIKSKLQFEELEKALRINAQMADTLYFWREAFNIEPPHARTAESKDTGKEEKIPHRPGLDGRKVKKALRPVKFKWQ